MVAHNSLLLTLSNYGIRNKTLEWIQSFLSDRMQRVVIIIDGVQPEPTPLTSGVPQGSVLGPILLNAGFFIVDDTIVNHTISSIADTKRLQWD